jgi:hypothetical protein
LRAIQKARGFISPVTVIVTVTVIAAGLNLSMRVKAMGGQQQT